MLGFEVAGISVQPSELVKIVFVFFVASSLYRAKDFRNVVITTIVAALHVLILVASTDLGAALIVFVVYLVMLYVATRQPLYIAAGVGAGSVASVAAYFLFSHVRTRVTVWRDPFAVYNEGGYQVAQSLFAIGTGSWFGMGLCQGSPESIPVRDSDFIFSAIAEELGLIFALCLILIFVSCYIMFLNIAMQLHNQFYKLVALGLGTCYIFPGVSEYRRCYKIYSVYRSNPSFGELWRKLFAQHINYVCNHPGTLYCKRGRGRKH